MDDKLFDTVFSLPYTGFREFLVLYFTFLKPITKLTDKETLVAAEFLYRYFIYSTKYDNEDYVYDKLFKTEVKKEIGKLLNISLASLSQHILSLKKKGILIDGKFHKNIIPPVEYNENLQDFKVLLFFNKK